MTMLRHRARSLIRKRRTLPGGRSVLHYKERKAGKHKCKGCGNYLHGVPHSTNRKVLRSSISERKPNRIHGGSLCSKCVRAVITSMVEGMVE